MKNDGKDKDNKNRQPADATEAAFWFLWAADSGDVNGLLEGLRLGVDPNERDADGSTALMKAAASSLGCVNLLLPLSDVGAVDEKQENALMRAAAAGNAECVARLAPLFDLTVKSIDGWSAIQQAAIHNRPQCAQALAGASDLKSRAAALASAAHGGYLECVKVLAAPDACAQINANGANALIGAVAKGHADCVRALAAWSALDGLGSEKNQSVEAWIRAVDESGCAAALAEERARSERAILLATLSEARSDAALLEKQKGNPPGGHLLEKDRASEPRRPRML